MTPTTSRHCLTWTPTGWLLAYLSGTTLYLRRYAGQSYTDTLHAGGVTSAAVASYGDRVLLVTVAGKAVKVYRSADGGRSFVGPSSLASGVSSGASPVAYLDAASEAFAWGSGKGVYTLRYAGNQWQGAERLTSESTAGFPTLAGDGDGRLWCAWREGSVKDGYRVMLAERPPGQSWTTGVQIAEGMDPSLAWDGDLWLGYHTGGFAAYVARLDADGTMEAARLDSCGLYVSLAPGVATWAHYSEPGDPKADHLRTVGAATWDGRSWLPWSPTTATGYQVQAGIAVGEQGSAVGWADKSGKGAVCMVERAG